jgi:hypothetical protein
VHEGSVHGRENDWEVVYMTPKNKLSTVKNDMYEMSARGARDGQSSLLVDPSMQACLSSLPLHAPNLPDRARHS